MMGGGKRIRRQIHDIGKIIPVLEQQGLEVQYRGNEHQSIDTHAEAVQQVVRQKHRAHGAIALSGDEFGRIPTMELDTIEPDKLAYRLHILLDAVIGFLGLLRILGGRLAAETGPHGVDEHQVGEVQPAKFIVYQGIRGW